MVTNLPHDPLNQRMADTNWVGVGVWIGSDYNFKTCEMTIFKYQLKVTDEQTIRMPKDAMILTAQAQGQFFICLWAIVDPDAEQEERTFEIIGTGNHVSLRPREYIATVQLGLFVWHIFEINPAATKQERE